VFDGCLSNFYLKAYASAADPFSFIVIFVTVIEEVSAAGSCSHIEGGSRDVRSRSIFAVVGCSAGGSCLFGCMFAIVVSRSMGTLRQVSDSVIANGPRGGC